jgi:4-aminobutyrate aminotransferase
MSHAELLARHRRVMPSWIALYYDQPIELVDGKGCRVVDAEGRGYLDFFAGILTTMVGYNPPEVVEAVRDQAGRMVHTSTLYLIRQQVELAERIAELSGIPDAKVFFTNSGTEANEAALLLATAARRSNQVLAMRNSYHGRSYAAMAVTGNRAWSASGFTPLHISYVLGANHYRSPLRDLPDDRYLAAYADDLRELLDTTTAGTVACLIAEPVQGVGGFTFPPDGFYGALKEVLDAHGILFVSDEVQTGWGRTGEHFWGYQAHGIVPDVLTFAKGLGNGLPIGGVVARAELMDAVEANSISTFGGNPLATRAAAATLEYLLSHDLQANARTVGARLLDGLTRITAGHPAVGDVRGKGLMLAVELVVPGSTTPDPAAAARAQEEARRGGLLIGKGGLYGNVLRVAPPLILTEAEADEGLEVLAAAIATI